MSVGLLSYAQFISTTTQSLVTLNTPIALTYDVQGPTKDGISHTGSRISVTRSGTYFVSTSIQVSRLVGNTSTEVLFWFRVNGVDVPNSASYITMTPQTDSFLVAVTVFLPLVAGQYFEVVFANDDDAGDTSAVALPAQVTPYVAPVSPSIITCVFFMG